MDAIILFLMIFGAFFIVGRSLYKLPIRTVICFVLPFIIPISGVWTWDILLYVAMMLILTTKSGIFYLVMFIIGFRSGYKLYDFSDDNKKK